nr:MAG TPA: hypothetical protein [Caudoviricetes sp.]DAP13683.1 MAG TPA: hypothetical protein [Caudoviricetes sp.]
MNNIQEEGFEIFTKLISFLCIYGGRFYERKV